MKIFKWAWRIVKVMLKAILKMIKIIILAFPLAMGNIFYYKPDIDNRPGGKTIGREKDD